MARRDVRVDTVPDPTIEQPTDAIIRVTSTGLCGSDLHLYEVLGPFLDAGDVLGHEPMGIVEAVGSGVDNLAVGDRVVVPFNISCGHCFMCEHGLQSAVRDDAEPRRGHGRQPLRLHEALRRGAGRPGGAAARPAGPLRADQGPRGPAGRPLPVPLRRPADGVAGRAVRPDPRRRQRGRHRPGPDRRDVDADRPAPGRRARSSGWTSCPSAWRARRPTAWRRSTSAPSTTCRRPCAS